MKGSHTHPAQIGLPENAPPDPWINEESAVTLTSHGVFFVPVPCIISFNSHNFTGRKLWLCDV